jgi:uncharacterized membrane protein
MLLERSNQIGAGVAISIFSLYTVMFGLRMLNRAELGHWIASAQFLAVIPLVYLLAKAPKLERPALYYIQVALFLAFLALDLFLDYILKVDFRQTGWAVISFVTFFFAATGGLLGIASNAGRGSLIAALALYLIMAVLAFVSRAMTGI